MSSRLVVRAYGIIYPAEIFTKVGPTTRDFLIFQMKDGKPLTVFQPKGTDTFIKEADAPTFNPDGWFVEPVLDNGVMKYRTVHPSNLADLYVYFTREYRDWIKAEGMAVHQTSHASITPPVGQKVTFSHAVITSRSTDPAAHACVPVYLPIQFDTGTTRFWTTPSGDPAQYVRTLETYDVKLLNDMSWYTAEFALGVKKALGVDVSQISETAAPPIYDKFGNNINASALGSPNFMIFVILFFIIVLIFAIIYMYKMRFADTG